MSVELMLWEPNPGDVSTNLLEPMLIIKTNHIENKGTRNVYIRETDFEKCGRAAECPAYEVHRARLPMSDRMM